MFTRSVNTCVLLGLNELHVRHIFRGWKINSKEVIIVFILYAELQLMIIFIIYFSASEVHNYSVNIFIYKMLENGENGYYNLQYMALKFEYCLIR